MKKAVSIPDDVFENAERMAQFSETAGTQKSRSQLFSEALREYVARHSPNEVTEAMNRVCDEREPPDSFVLEAGRRILQQNEW